MSKEKRKITPLINWLKKHKRLWIGIATINIIIFMIFFVDFQILFSKIIVVGLWGTIIFILAYNFTFLLRALKLKLIFKGLDVKLPYLTSYFSIGISSK